MLPESSTYLFACALKIYPHSLGAKKLVMGNLAGLWYGSDFSLGISINL